MAKKKKTKYEKVKAKSKPGSGARFKALKQELAHKPGVYDPAGLAAYIGRKKYGKKKMAKWAAKGRKKK